MRKANREITDFQEILDLVQNTNTIRLGLQDTPYPYVVPVSFGFTAQAGRLTFYFHGAAVGKKVSLLAQDPHVCVEGDLFYRYKKTQGSVTCLYESFIAYGCAERLTGTQAVAALQQILQHCGYGAMPVEQAALTAVGVYRVVVDSITGKCREKNN